MLSARSAGRPPAISGPLRKLVDAAGGVGKLARLIGVNASTIRRWDSSPPSSRAWRLLVAQLALALRVQPPWPIDGRRS